MPPHISKLMLHFHYQPHHVTAFSGRCLVRGSPFDECREQQSCLQHPARSYETQKTLKPKHFWAPVRVTLVQRRRQCACPDERDRFKLLARHRLASPRLTRPRHPRLDPEAERIRRKQERHRGRGCSFCGTSARSFWHHSDLRRSLYGLHPDMQVAIRKAWTGIDLTEQLSYIRLTYDGKISSRFFSGEKMWANSRGCARYRSPSLLMRMPPCFPLFTHSRSEHLLIILRMNAHSPSQSTSV